MEEPIGGSSQPATGNAEIPEWMLKRRARQALAAEPNPGEKSISAPDVPVPGPESQAPAASDVASSRQAPAWFKPKKAAAPKPSLPKAEIKKSAIPAIKPQPVEPLDWYAEFRERWLSKSARRSYALSLFVHVLVALPLSVVVLRAQVKPTEFNSVLIDSDGLGGGGLDDTSIFQADPAGGQPDPAADQDLDSMLAASNLSSVLGPSSLELSKDIGGTVKGGGGTGGGGEGDGEGGGIGDGLSVGGYKMPAGGKAVSKGSFTAWTVPEDPAPGQDYKIVIQVKYKKANQKVTRGDVTGSIVGTDNYRLAISPETSKIFTESNQVVVQVPGADARVRDTIRVYSAKLRESQRLEIVF